MNDPELHTLIQRAYQDSPLAAQALYQNSLYNAHIHVEHSCLLQMNQELWLEQTQYKNIHEFQSAVLHKTDSDLAFVQQLNKKLEPFSPSDQGSVTWSLKTNKMDNILSHAKELLSDESYISKLILGHFPDAFKSTISFPVLLGSDQTPYGNSQLTYFSAALIETHLTLLGNTSTIQDIVLTSCNDPFEKDHYIDYSALLHMTPIPAEINSNAIFSQDFSFYFSDNTTPHGLAFVHSGYAFGGQRGENRYDVNKLFGPEDCSSWIAKITGSEILYSTLDQLYTYRLALPEDKRGVVDPDWMDSPTAKTMTALYSPVSIEDPLKDIHPGQIMAYRTFANEDHADSTGLSGHTVLVIGVREDGHVVTLGYARNMPEYEGFGIKEFFWQSTKEKEVMFFDVKTPLHIDDVISNPSDPLKTFSVPAEAPVNHPNQPIENIAVSVQAHLPELNTQNETM